MMRTNARMKYGIGYSVTSVPLRKWDQRLLL